jgi:hypothetical protein
MWLTILQLLIKEGPAIFAIVEQLLALHTSGELSPKHVELITAVLDKHLKA